MINRINLTENSTKITSSLHHSLRLRPNITSRNAFLYSLGKGDRLDQKTAVKCDGKELNTQILFGDSAYIYFMLLRQYYGKSLDKYNLRHLIAYHIDGGLSDPEFINILKAKI